MKKLFKKSLAICLMAALVLTALMGAMVVSAEGVVATKGTLTGNIEFAYNTPINFEPVDGATAYGAEVYRTDKGEWQAVDVVFASIDEAIVGISNISLNNITKTFTFKPYAVVNEAKVYAETFTSSYAEWLVAKKDGNKFNAELNNILDTYAAITGETVYDGQVADLEAAPEIGADDKWVATDAGNAAVKGSFNTAGGANTVQVDLDIDYPLSGFVTSVVGENLVSNGDFADGMTGWSKWGDNGHSFDNGVAGTKGGTYIWNTTAFDIEDNTNYRVTFKLYSEAAASAIDFEFALQNGKEQNKFTHTSTIAAHNGHAVQSFDACANGNTVTYTFDFNSGTTFNLAEAAKNNKLFIAFRTLGSSDWVYIDDVTCHKVDMSTPYGPHAILDNGFDTNDLYYEWMGTNLGFAGQVGAYDGGKTDYGKNPIDGSITWAWLSGADSPNGTMVNIEPNTYYTFSADIYVPEGKTLYFAIHGGTAYNDINNDVLVTRKDFASIDNGSWRSVSWQFYSGDYSGDYWLTVAEYGTFTGTATLPYDTRPRYDSVKIVPCAAGAKVYKDSAEIADVKFAANDTFAVAISNISFANMAKQYTIVPYTLADDGAATLGEEVVVSYADFLAHALNKGNADQKAQAYAIVKAYKAAYGVDLVSVKVPENLVTNGEFDDSLTDWSSKNANAYELEGNYCAQLISANNNGSKQDSGIWRNIKVEKNTKYVLTYDLWAGSREDGETPLWINFGFDAVATPDDNLNAVVTKADVAGEAEVHTWQTYTFEVETGDNEYIYLGWYVGGKPSSWEHRTKIDNVKLIAVE